MHLGKCLVMKCGRLIVKLVLITPLKCHPSVHGTMSKKETQVAVTRNPRKARVEENQTIRKAGIRNSSHHEEVAEPITYGTIETRSK